MSQANKEPAKDPTRDLAVEIYIELISRAVTVTENAAKINASPESLAKISFKLAEAFEKAEAEIMADARPKNQNFNVGAVDIGSWGKTP